MAATAPASEEQNTGYLTTILSRENVESVRNDKNVSEAARSRLRAEANHFLHDQGPFSVLQKSLTPPSGDKHDYLSFGPYWWPDPAKKDGLPYIRRDGEVNPEAVGPGSDRVALEQMAAGAETLALAWFFTGERNYAERSALFIRTWFLNPQTRMNPHLRYGQGIPGQCEGRGIGLIEPRRFSQVINALQLLNGSEALSPEEVEAIRSWFRTYLRWMLESENGKTEAGEKNNHGTWYDVQVAHFALFTGQRDLALKVVREGLEKRLAQQVKPDGSQPHELARTRAYTYSLINLSGLLDLADLGKELGIDYWAYEREKKRLLPEAVAFLGAYTDPAAKWPFRQITGFDAQALYPLLYAAYYNTGQERFAQMIARLDSSASATDRANLLHPARP